jgi:hypothetical protein
MPAIPAEESVEDPVPLSSSSSLGGRELFPMPVVPEEESPRVSVTASSLHPELFPMPSIPEADPANTPAPLTEAELEMQALIQNAIGNNPAVTAPNVSVALSAEGIELSGTVASAQAKLAASRLAKSYAAGRKVVDRITVAANPPEMHPQPSPVRADSAATAHQQHP